MYCHAAPSFIKNTAIGVTGVVTVLVRVRLDRSVGWPWFGKKSEREPGTGLEGTPAQAEGTAKTQRGEGHTVLQE